MLVYSKLLQVLQMALCFYFEVGEKITNLLRRTFFCRADQTNQIRALLIGLSHPSLNLRLLSQQNFYVFNRFYTRLVQSLS